MLPNPIPNIFAVIPTFNRKTLLQRCLTSLFSQTLALRGIIIIDDGSNDGTADIIRKFDQNIIQVINGDGNWWWTKCMNKGFLHALNERCDYILAMNDDTYLAPDAAEHLVETSIKYPKSIVSCCVFDHCAPETCIGKGFLFGWNEWIPASIPFGNIDGRAINYSEGHTGRGVLFPREVINSLGFYDEVRFPMKGDHDYSYRCIKTGIQQLFDTGARVYLETSTTVVGAQSIRLGLGDAYKTLTHINGVYNVYYAYRFFRKHLPLTWWYRYFLWILFATGKLSIRILPGTSRIYLYLRNLRKNQLKKRSGSPGHF